MKNVGDRVFGAAARPAETAKAVGVAAVKRALVLPALIDDATNSADSSIETAERFESADFEERTAMVTEAVLEAGAAAVGGGAALKGGGAVQTLGKGISGATRPRVILGTDMERVSQAAGKLGVGVVGPSRNFSGMPLKQKARINDGDVRAKIGEGAEFNKLPAPPGGDSPLVEIELNRLKDRGVGVKEIDEP